MIVIKNLKTPDTWSNDEYEEYVYNRLLDLLKKEKVQGDIRKYTLTGMAVMSDG